VKTHLSNKDKEGKKRSRKRKTSFVVSMQCFVEGPQDKKTVGRERREASRASRESKKAEGTFKGKRRTSRGASAGSKARREESKARSGVKRK
jgi:hypothetical protein